IDGKQTDESMLVTVEQSEKDWIPIREFMEILAYQTDQNGDTVQIGDTDPLYTVRADTFTAMIGNEPRILTQAPRNLADGRLYITLESIADLLNMDVSWDAGQRVVTMDSHPGAVVMEGDDDNQV